MTTLGTTLLNFDALLHLIIFFRYVQLIFLKKLLWPFLKSIFSLLLSGILKISHIEFMIVSSLQYFVL